MLVLMASYALGKPLPYDKVAVGRTNAVKHTDSKIKRIASDLEFLSIDQLAIMHFVMDVGDIYNMKYTLTAIAYKESKFGIYLINPITGDYGILGVNLKNFLAVKKVKSNYWKDMELASRLTVDNSLNVSVAIDNLKYWRSKVGNNWRVIWGSYNGGWRPSAKYAEDILNIIKAIKLYESRHSH